MTELTIEQLMEAQAELDKWRAKAEAAERELKNMTQARDNVCEAWDSQTKELREANRLLVAQLAAVIKAGDTFKEQYAGRLESLFSVLADPPAAGQLLLADIEKKDAEADRLRAALYGIQTCKGNQSVMRERAKKAINGRTPNNIACLRHQINEKDELLRSEKETVAELTEFVANAEQAEKDAIKDFQEVMEEKRLLAAQLAAVREAVNKIGGDERSSCNCDWCRLRRLLADPPAAAKALLDKVADQAGYIESLRRRIADYESFVDKEDNELRSELARRQQLIDELTAELSRIQAAADNALADEPLIPASLVFDSGRLPAWGRKMQAWGREANIKLEMVRAANIEHLNTMTQQNAEIVNLKANLLERQRLQSVQAAECVRLRSAIQLIWHVYLSRATHLGLERKSGLHQGCIACICALAVGPSIDGLATAEEFQEALAAKPEQKPKPDCDYVASQWGVPAPEPKLLNPRHS